MTSLASTRPAAKSLEIQQMPLSKLIPAPYNPRRVLTPKSKPWQKLRAGIIEFGLVEPLIWNRTTGHLVGGHLRRQILEELGWDQAPVSIVELDPGREKSLNILLNNAEAQGRYDPHKLEELLGELEDTPEFSLCGFEQSHLDDLRLQPVEEELTPISDPETLEVVLELTQAKYQEIETDLSALITQHNLTSHTRGLWG
jgi:ParB-like chromosome segregation protein Spo0J